MKRKVIGLLILLLFFIAPFIQSDTSDESQPDMLISVPPVISTISFYLRWIIIGILVVYFFVDIKKLYKYFTSYNVYFALFYFFPLLFAIITVTDVERYVTLFLLTLFLPVVISSQFEKTKNYLSHNNLRNVIAFFLIASLVVSSTTILSGLRFQGILGNSNMYGISAVFWLSILQLQNKNKYTLFLSVLLFITIVLSGSRGSLVAAITVIFFSYTQHLKKLLTASVLLILIFTLLSNYLNLDFIFNRFDSIASSASDSGRQDIWETAFVFINQNYMGYGMNAPLELLGTGNVHNCYVRFLLTMGYPFTILMVLCLILLITTAFFDKKIPKTLVGFLIGYCLANFGEDFFVGVGSSIFIYVILTIGLLGYYKNLKPVS